MLGFLELTAARGHKALIPVGPSTVFVEEPRSDEGCTRAYVGGAPPFYLREDMAEIRKRLGMLVAAGYPAHVVTEEEIIK